MGALGSGMFTSTLNVLLSTELPSELTFKLAASTRTSNPPLLGKLAPQNTYSMMATARHKTSSISPTPTQRQRLHSIRSYDTSRMQEDADDRPGGWTRFSKCSLFHKPASQYKPQPRPPTPTQPTCAGSPPLGLRRGLQFQLVARLEWCNDSSMLVDAGRTTNNSGTRLNKLFTFSVLCTLIIMCFNRPAVMG